MLSPPPADFQAEKSHIVVGPGLVFVKETKTQTLPTPRYGIFNGGEGINVISQPSYSPNMAKRETGIWLQRGEIRAGRLLVVPGWPNNELRGGHPNQQQKRDGCRLLAIVGRQNRLCVGIKQS